MAALNEAYRVLRHPVRRADYDAALAAMQAEPSVRSAPRPAAPPRPRSMQPVAVDDRPARYPWKLVIVSAAIGAAAVLTLAALNEPSQEPARPDNLLQPGSCVAIEANEDVREVNCTGAAGELVVQELVPLDGACPPGIPAYRDRQGMGFACVTRRSPSEDVEAGASLRSPPGARSSVG